MRKFIAIAGAVAMSAGMAYAAGTHTGGHGHGHGHQKAEEHHGHGHDDGHGHGEMMEVGRPGDPAKVTRTIEILMIETDDGEMLFEPDNVALEELEFKAGETVLFKITNAGELVHEFVLDTVVNNERHREMMERFPEMEHDDPNSITLQPGEVGEIAWTFSNSGDFQFACLIPGHMEAGMHGPIDVTEN